MLHQQLTGQIEVLKEQIRAQEDQEVRLKERKSVIESELSGKEKQRKAEQQAFLLAKEKQEQVSLTEGGLLPGSGCDDGDALPSGNADRGREK